MLDTLIDEGELVDDPVRYELGLGLLISCELGARLGLTRVHPHKKQVSKYTVRL